MAREPITTSEADQAHASAGAATPPSAETRRERLAVASTRDEVSEVQTRGGEGEVIPLVEEEFSVAKRELARKVRVRTVVDTVEELARATLESEKVEITRVPVDRIVEQAPAVRTEDDVVIVPVLEEIMVVEKRLVLKEELHIRRRIETEAFEAPVTLRKQRAVVERDDADTSVEVERDPASKLGDGPR